MRFLKTAALTRTVAAALALSVAGMTVPATAQAGHGWHYHKPYVVKHAPRHHFHLRKHRRSDSLAAGIFGFVAGAAIASTLGQPRYYHPVPRARIYHAPAPWTADWYAYCASKYPTFDVRSGLYLARSGVWRYCQ